MSDENDPLDNEIEFAKIPSWEPSVSLNDSFEVDALLALDENALVDAIDYMWMTWANFGVQITQPYVPHKAEPTIIDPDPDEFVYKIFDYGNRFTTSRGDDMIKGQRTMGKLFQTIEKIMGLVELRIKNNQAEGESGEGDDEPVAYVAFEGHELGQRKALETALNLDSNIEVLNYSEWGEVYLERVKKMVDLGYGYPKSGIK